MKRSIVSLILCVACSMIPALRAGDHGHHCGYGDRSNRGSCAGTPVTITNTATGATRTMNTNSSGDYPV